MGKIDSLEFLDSFIEQIDSLTAVSYTHLDVYKRQGCMTTNLWQMVEESIMTK